LGGIVKSIFGGGEPAAPAPAPNPTPPAAPDNSAALAERDAAAELERQRRISVGKSATNPTGGLGDTSTPSLAAKSLLG